MDTMLGLGGSANGWLLSCLLSGRKAARVRKSAEKHAKRSTKKTTAKPASRYLDEGVTVDRVYLHSAAFWFRLAASSALLSFHGTSAGFKLSLAEGRAMVREVNSRGPWLVWSLFLCVLKLNGTPSTAGKRDRRVKKNLFWSLPFLTVGVGLFHLQTMRSLVCVGFFSSFLPWV